MNNNTGLAEMVAKAVKAKLEEEATPIDLSEIERTTRQLLQEIGGQAVKMAVALSQPKYVEPTVLCGCGNEAKYVRRRKARLYTILGQITVKRAYYVCGGCHKGQSPLDKQLGLRPNALSAELARLVALTGVQIPFQKGSELFKKLTLVSVSDQTMSKASRQMGKRVVQQETYFKQQAIDPDYLRQQRQESRPPLRLYGAIDAAKVNIRAAKKEHGWRDLKLGAWFEARGQPPTTPDGEWRIAAEKIDYFADIGPAADFSPLVWATAVQRRAHLARELIILGDGADWIWNIVAENFPDAIQILDWFHASEHLMPVAQAVFTDEAQQTQWVSEMRQLMWDGETDVLIATCRSLAAAHPHDVIRKAANYFDTHKSRMRYAHFRSQGFQIGSGTIESAAKQIGLMRMKVPGAMWREENAVLVAKARASFLSQRWHELPLAA